MDWTQDEVTAAVRDYFAMLRAELVGQPYSKTAHRRALIEHLNGRSHGSVERKHQNISAVLVQIGLPYITGYKPLGNYQALLAREVERFIGRNSDIMDAVRADVERPAEMPALDDYLGSLVDAPSDDDFVTGVLLETTHPLERPGALAPTTWRRSRATDPSVLQERSSSWPMSGGGCPRPLGEPSQTRSSTSRRRMAMRLASTCRSFDSRGGDLFIEVKTTRYGVLTPFFVSSNELGFSRAKRDSYRLYRVFEFRERPRLFVLPGAVDERCALYPQVYRAWPPQAV